MKRDRAYKPLSTARVLGMVAVFVALDLVASAQRALLLPLVDAGARCTGRGA